MKRSGLKKINLLEGNILKKLILLSAPLMATSFVSMAYTMTDTAWVGRIGASAVAAAGAANFFTWMGQAIASISRVGTTVYVAQEYGSKQEEKLFDSIKNGIILQIILTLMYTAFILIVKRQVLGFYGLEKNVEDMAVQYLQIMSYGFIFSFLSMIFSSIYNALGNSVFPFVANFIGMVLNIFIDPIMIFGFGPIPAMGIKGAALASILSQFIVFLILLTNIISTKNEIYQAISKGKIHFNNMFEKFRKGLPVGLMSLAHANISLILGKYMAQYGTEPVAAFSVGSTVESLTWMTIEGLQGGITSFVGQNYGAKLYARLREVIKKSVQTVLTIGVISSVIIIGFRYQLFKLFIPNDPKTLEYGAMYLYIIGFSQLAMSAEIGITGIINGLGETRLPAVVSIVFNLLRIPMALLLMPLMGVYGVWTSMTISSILKGIFTFVVLQKEKRRMPKE